MDHSVNYELIENNKILIRSFEGPITITEVIASWEYLIKNKVLSEKVKGVISDYRKAVADVEIDDLEKLNIVFNDNKSIFYDLKLAVVADSTVVTIPLLYESEKPEINLHTFTTMEAALNWMHTIITTKSSGSLI